MKKIHWDAVLMPLVGITLTLLAWQLISGRTVIRSLADGTEEEVKLGWVQDLPGPVQTWEKTRKYVVEPFAKREELDQGILIRKSVWVRESFRTRATFR